MCHESSGVGADRAIGIGKGTVTLDDFDEADADLRDRPEPGHEPPADAHRAREGQARGGAIVTVNPLPKPGMHRFKHPQTVARPRSGAAPTPTDLFLQIKVGGDLALFKGILNRMLLRASATDPNVVDRAFIDEYTHGFEDFAAHHAEGDDAEALAEAVRRTGRPPPTSNASSTWSSRPTRSWSAGRWV